MSCHHQGLWTRRVCPCNPVLEFVSGPRQCDVGADVEGPAPGPLERCMKTWDAVFSMAAVLAPGLLFIVWACRREKQEASPFAKVLAGWTGATVSWKSKRG